MLEKYDFMAKLDKYREYAPMVLRIVLGIIFVGHGWQKLTQFTPAGFSGMIAGWGVPAGIALVLGWIVTLTELLGGIALILGFMTRYAAKLISIVMIVAIAMVHFKNGLFGQGGYEFALALLAMAVSLELTGPGKFALDDIICKKHKKR